MKIFSCLLLIPLLGWCRPVSAAPGASDAGLPRLNASLSRSRISVGGLTELVLEVSWRGEPEELEFTPPDPPVPELLVPVESGQETSVTRDGGETRRFRRYIFTFRGENRGRGKIGPVEISYRHRDGDEEYRLTSPPLEISVAGGAGRWIPAWLSGAGTIAGILAGAVLLGFYIAWTVKRYRKKANRMIRDYAESVEEESLKELNALPRLRLAGEIEEYYLRLARIFSGYLEKKYGEAPSAADIEKEEKLPGLSEEERGVLAAILHELEESRFGRYPRTGSAQTEILKRIYSFISARQKESADTEESHRTRAGGEKE